MRILLLALLALPLAAQTPITLTRSECPPSSASTLRLVVYAPATVAGRPVNVPVCVDFTDATLTNVAGVLKLQLPKPVTPILRIESVPLTTTTDVNMMDHTLAAAPIQGSPVLWFLSGSRGRDSGAVAANGRLIKIMLPEHRPFTADDVITIVYQAEP